MQEKMHGIKFQKFLDKYEFKKNLLNLHANMLDTHTLSYPLQEICL